MTTERPMVFSGPMVRALLEGRKTMTRRIAPVLLPGDKNYIIADNHAEWVAQRALQCPHGKPGDQLWVRETFAPRLKADGAVDPNARYAKYRADGNPNRSPCDEMDWHSWPARWTPSIFMPRWASRITLDITDVRVERLQDISEADARAEGVRYHEASHVRGDGPCFRTAIEGLGQLWNSLNGKTAPWVSNPWVWAISFRRIPQDRSHGAQITVPM